MNYNEWVDFITSKFPIPDTITNDWILSQLNADNKNDGFNMFMLWGFCYRDLRSYDLREIDKEVLLKVTFDSTTKWPLLLPSGFNPNAIIENKRLSYGFKEVHELGITGKGVLVAVIDHPSNIDHIEIRENIKEYIIPDESFNDSHFHGLAVLSHLCGKNIGIAPDVEIVFYGGQPYVDGTEEECNEEIINFGIVCLEDIKRKIIKGQAISIVNMSNSWLYNGSDRLKQKAIILVKELEELGCTVIDSPKFFECFRYLDCKAIDDSENIDNYYLPPFFRKDSKDRLNFLSGGKLTASYLTKDKYIFKPVGSASYSIPQLSGFFALALQINPKLTYTQFISFCKEKAITNKDGVKIVNPVHTLMAIKIMFKYSYCILRNIS